MASFQNKIFKNDSIAMYSMTSRDRYNRSHLYSAAAYKSLNTYLNMGIFPTQNDVTQLAWDENGEEYEAGTKNGNDMAGIPGVRSIFSKQSSIATGGNPGDWDAKDMLVAGRTKQWQQVQNKVLKNTEYRKSHNAPLMDSPDTRAELRELGACSVRDLVQASKKGVFGRAGYDYSDFMYCKHLGEVPNNYMITVRRYAGAVGDGVLPQGAGSSRKRWGKNNGAIPIGTMVTWLGVSGNNMENILKYSYKMSFKEETAKWEEPTDMGGGEGGLLNGLEATMNPATRKAFNNGATVPAMAPILGFFGLSSGQGVYKSPTDKAWKDSNSLYPEMIDNVMKLYRRGQDGLNFDWKFSLVFEYELRAYNGINPRQAMLDLLSSILSVTYTKGGFWGGGYLPTGGYPQMSSFRNLNIFKAHGTATGYFDALMKDIRNVKQKFSAEINSLDDLWKAAKKVLNVAGGMLFGALTNAMGRPKKYMYPSLLRDVPVGFWHITIGNPKRPIIMSGNMILTNTTIEHSGPLGLDDFPTNLKVTMEFDRGRPRDKWGIERMYMRGDDRIALSMSNAIMDMYASANAYKKRKDNTAKPITIDSTNDMERLKSLSNTKSTYEAQSMQDEENERTININNAQSNLDQANSNLQSLIDNNASPNDIRKAKKLVTSAKSELEAAEHSGIKKDGSGAALLATYATYNERGKLDPSATIEALNKSVQAGEVRPSDELIEAFGTADPYAILEPAMEMQQGFHKNPQSDDVPAEAQQKQAASGNNASGTTDATKKGA